MYIMIVLRHILIMLLKAKSNLDYLIKVCIDESTFVTLLYNSM